jgi:polysaccharide export outer membrane protein
MKKGFTTLGLSVLIFFMTCPFLFTPPIFAQGAPWPNMTAQPLPGQFSEQQLALSLDACQKLPLGQRAVCEEEMRKTGGVITPEALEAIRARSEYRGLSAEEVARGRQLLEQRERIGEKKGSGKSLQADFGKRVIGEDSREKSLFDRSRKIGKYQDIAVDLKPYGYDFFTDASVRLLTERKDIPVPLKYIIGPGDEIKLLLWGRINAQYNLMVDREGKITIPQIGPLFVAGMTIEDMTKQITTQSEQFVGTHAHISMGSLKTIPIFILGDVRRPGSYTIGSFATITDALLLAGGPTEIGSMRNVQLKRKGQLVTTFDLYDLLLKGDKSKDVSLMAGDVVFVPVTGPLVGIAGNVKRPAIYELRNRFDLDYLFDLAGGIIPTADTQQIQVERIIKNERQVVLDINDKKLEKTARINLQDADLVKVFSIVDMNVNAVYLSGNVKRPGKYEMKPGMHLSDLIKSPDDLLKETYFDYALVKRLKLPERETELIPVNIGKVLFQQDPASNIELKREDQVFIFSRWFFKDKPLVTIEGEIRGDCIVEPGSMPEKKRSDAGSFAAEMKNVEPGVMTGQKRSDTGGLAAEMKNVEPGVMPGKKRFDAGSFAAEMKNVEPGVMQGQKRSDTGGLAAETKDVEPGVMPEQKRFDTGNSAAEMKDVEEDLKKQGLFNLANTVREVGDTMKTYGRAPADNLRMVRDDLTKLGRLDLAERIREIENKLKISCTIGLSGNMRVQDVIFAAGGLTNDSYLEKGEIIRTNNQRVYKTIYFDVAKAMEGDPEHNLTMQDEDRIVIHSVWEQIYKKQVVIDGDIAKPGSYQYTDGMTVRDLVFKGGNIQESAYVDEAEVSSIVIEKGRKTSKTERQVINLKKALEGDPADNLVLKPYDRLFIKRIPDWGAMKFVTVTGEFKFPGRYAVHKGEKLSSLIERAGGFTSNAYLRGTVFIRLSVKELQQQGLEEMANRLERELLVHGSAAASTALSAEELKAKEVEMVQKQKFVETLKSLKAQGRMTIRLANLRLLKGSEYDIELEDGDRLHLPQKNNVVNVMGAVMGQASYIYLDQFSYKDYISMAGGYARYADDSSTFILKVDGSARKLGKGFLGWNDNRSRWELTAFGEKIKEIEPGDVIVVPEQFERIAWLREVRDITQILMNAAVVAAVVLKLF